MQYIVDAHYLKFCNNNKLLIIKYFNKIKNPLISVITPIHNSANYIIRFLNSIQNQKFKNIEILFIDDKSLDNSIKIIEKYQRKDKRILLIKNIKNKGTFRSRNIGTIYSKGKYLILPDPDDIISKSILNICYNLVEKSPYDIIKFNIYTINKNLMLDNFNNHENIKIYQPQLSIHNFYGKNELQLVDGVIWNKFIKKDLYIRALNYLKKRYLKMYIVYFEDTMMNYILFRTANSYLSINKNGYFYIRNNLSITNSIFSESDFRIKFTFIFLKLIIEYSKNTKIEKDMANYLLTKYMKSFNILRILKKINIKSLNFYRNIIKKYYICKYINEDNKFILKTIINYLKQKNLNYKFIKLFLK